MSVVVFTELLDNEPYRQVGVCRQMTSENLGGVMVSTLAWNARGVGSVPTLGAIFPNFLTPTTIHIHTHI